MLSRWVPVVCIAALSAAFVTDVLTPQILIAAILLDVPIVLSSMRDDRRFTYAMVLAALCANVIAGYVNGMHDNYQWNAIALLNRAFAGLTIVVVGYLSTAAQRNAQRTGRLVAQKTRAEREAKLAAAVDRVRASLSPDLVLRAIARETIGVLDADSARFVVLDAGRTVTFLATSDASDVRLDERPQGPELASLVERTLERGDVLQVRRSDALGRLVLDTLGAQAALAIPIADRNQRVGVIFAAGHTTDAFEETLALARAFSDQATNALAQSRLFSALGKRNDALEERGAVIRDLVYALSHDLRTPLAALGMTLRQADAGTYGELPARYREILQSSVVAIDDVSRLADTLLLVARMESGDRRPSRDVVELGPMARQIASELEALATAAQVAVTVEEHSPAATIGDPGDLRRAVTNLVANALAHTPPGGRVTIEIARESGAALVRVIDDGYGVTEIARRHLFDRFARSDSRMGGGSGLGLYIVRRVAEESHGAVTYEARSPHGSVFTLRLPVPV
ncbi:MAG: HAMP domain-containing histidine kinase [Candidatus Eremiobacteraeota bacterium]|nr:HAMP domain-containing histidine kinase [Candidatus Eremiobacteraeota bacterium]